MYAIEEGFLSAETAVEHAIAELEKNENPAPAIIDLACLKKGESIHPYIDNLAGTIPEHKNKETQEKILYALLNWVYEKKNEYSDPFEVVEIIYADFDYPKNISKFVRYMPCDQLPLGTLEENIGRLYNNWKLFLDMQKQKYNG